MLDLPVHARCELCLGPVGSSRRALCGACVAALPRARGHCPQCTRRLPAGGVCGECLRHGGLADRVVAAVRYDAACGRLVQALKFEGRYELAATMGAIFVARLADGLAGWPDCLVPVPLHPRRLRARGYDQARELALAISDLTALPVDSSWVRRIRHTGPQSTLDPAERRRNLRHAFLARGERSYRRIALIDDVITTGATVRALRSALGEREDRSIQAWAFAAALR